MASCKRETEIDWARITSVRARSALNSFQYYKKLNRTRVLYDTFGHGVSVLAATQLTTLVS